MLKDIATQQDNCPLEAMADELLRLKLAAENAKLELDIAKAALRDEVELGLTGDSRVIEGQTAMVRVQRSGKWSTPKAADLEGLSETTQARLFRRTAQVKPKPRANFRALLDQLEAAGIDAGKYFTVADVLGTVPRFGEAAEYVLDELSGEEAERLSEVVNRLRQPDTVIVKALEE